MASDLGATDTDGPLTWGLLLPVCYRGGDKEHCWCLIQGFVDSLSATTTAEDRAVGRLRCFVGVDDADPVFDTKEAEERLRRMLGDIGVPMKYERLRSSFRSKICHIWVHLAKLAVDGGCDLFCLLGDDVRLLTPGWKSEIERSFRSIASKRRLPLGLACVCFQDVSFPVFPTFPVMHKAHLEVFCGALFPPAFVNQHGDPFLFELYRRWGASEFAPTAQLDNTVGGSSDARYRKHAVLHWQGPLLSAAIQRLSHFCDDASRLMCLNVAIPSYRCNVPMLQQLSRLSVSRKRTACSADAAAGGSRDEPREWASVHILIVVDNPDTPNIEEVRQLQDWSPNHLVRVFKNPKNLGAPLSRNAGLAQSFGDWTVLLDDDVIPNPNLLDAYLGAILRHPDASVYVGLTELPPPKTLMQQALVASQMTFFYGVAKLMKHPPWGVTANICVPGRHNNSVWFSDAYPKTGGGEDVEFCFKLKERRPFHERHLAIVSVPEAVVQHPFWTDILRQISGWAKGDVLCLDALPHSSFLAPPNWAETLLLSAAILMLAGIRVALPVFLYWMPVIAACVLTTELLLGVLQTWPRTPRDQVWWKRLAVSVLAITPAIAQDAARLYSKVRRCRLNKILICFDWMDGQQPGDDYNHVVATRFSLLVRLMVSALLLGAVHFTVVAAGAVTASGQRLQAKPPCVASQDSVVCGPLQPAAGGAGGGGALLGAALCGCLVGLVLLFWSKSLSLNTSAYCAEYLRRLPPVPIFVSQQQQQQQAEEQRQVEGSSSGDSGNRGGSSGGSSTTTAIPGSPASPTTLFPSLPLTGAPPALRTQPFVVLAYQRTGSNLLCGILHNHPEILMHNEVFNEGRIFTYASGTANPLSAWEVSQRDHDPERFLIDVFTKLPSLPKFRGPACQDRKLLAVGMKLFPEHWQPSRALLLQRLVADTRVKKIVLRRRDYLAVYASKLRADKTGAYMAKALDDVRLHIDIPAFQAFVENYDACYAYYSKLLVGQGPGSVHHVFYEDLEDEATRDTPMTALLRFLGVDASHIPKPLRHTVKQSTAPLRQGIANWEELDFAFRHTHVAKSSG